MRHISKSSYTLIELLSDCYPDSSRTSLLQWIKYGRIAIGVMQVRDAHRMLQQGDEVQVLPKSTVLDEEIKLLFMDAHLIVVEKPPFLLSVSTPYERGKSAHQILRKRFGSIYPVHRLDRETSGLMVFARNESAKEGLKKQWMARMVKKHYLAWVEGSIQDEQGIWKDMLQSDQIGYRTIRSEGGKEAITEFKVKERLKNHTFLEFTIVTGRKHQIRKQAQLRGHPIVGDQWYGKGEQKGRKRLLLHSFELQFRHPATGKGCCFNSYPEPNFQVTS